MIKESELEWLKLLRLTLLLIFRPSIFIRECSRYENTIGLGNYHELRTRITNSICLIIFIALIAHGIAFSIGEPSHFRLMSTLRIIPLIFMAWAVLARIGWKYWTWGNVSIAEQIDGFWFRSVYCLGLFGTILSILLN